MTLLITAFGGANFWSIITFWPLECHALFGPNALTISLFVLPLGLGIVFGVILVNVAVTAFQGHNRQLLILSR